MFAISLARRALALAAPGAWGAAAGVGASVRSLFVRITGSPSAALRKLAAKRAREGLDGEGRKRARYIKPTLARSAAARRKPYLAAKVLRQELVEEALLDRKLAPF